MQGTEMHSLFAELIDGMFTAVGLCWTVLH